jgi:hypothetical protein
MNLAHLFAQKLYTVVMKPSDCMHKLESVGRRSGTVPKARGTTTTGWVLWASRIRRTRKSGASAEFSVDRMPRNEREKDPRRPPPKVPLEQTPLGEAGDLIGRND